MASGRRESVQRDLDRVFRVGTVAGLEEGQLLRRFVACRDGVAFEALVARHGPMVLAVCRRKLGDPHAVADAFQATFLVLIRKAGTLRDADQLGPWLHGVAFRIATRARSDSARRRERERRGARAEAVEGNSLPDRECLRGIIDEEVNRLPEPYRKPIILCYLEGLTHEQAAHRLRCTPGTLRGRLDRARAKLRSRLARRGLAPAAALAAFTLADETAAAAIPPALTAATIGMAEQALASGAVVRPASGAIAALSEWLLRTMFLSRLKLAASFVAGVSVLATVLALARGFDGVHPGLDPPDARTAARPRPVLATGGQAPDPIRRPVHIRGSVTDATTGKPVDKFRILPGYGNGQVPVWEAGKAIAALKGSYEINLPPGYRLRFVRIEAEGYLPVVSPGFTRDTPEQVFDARLQPGTGVAGIVRLPDGTPCAGADVVYGPWPDITNGQPPADPYAIVKTGPDGRFAFGAEKPWCPIVILDDRGFAERTVDQLAASREVTLQPWGRVEGTVRIGNRPGTGEILSLPHSPSNDSVDPHARFGAQATADASGHFVFERVVPGEVRLWRRFPTGPQTQNWSFLTLIDVKPGATARVKVGGSGRPVIGRLIAPAVIADWVDWSNDWGSSTERKQAVPRPPSGLDGGERVRWRLAWERSEEGKAFRQAERRYGLKIAPGGTFRVEDVEAGVYRLSITLADGPRPAEGPCRVGGLLAVADLEFGVPAMPGGRSDEPLDLGAITLRPLRKPHVVRVGDPAPAFRVETIDGKMLELAGYRGRFVLLHFWDDRCRACQDETPHLKAVYDASGRDPRFAMIGLGLDAHESSVRSYVDDHGLRYAQGIAAGNRDLLDKYALRDVPSIWLIGPDGTVLAKDLRGEAIEQAVAAALARPER
jgi:RNA polymerase sigma factor (sigma-70 family)